MFLSDTAELIVFREFKLLHQQILHRDWIQDFLNKIKVNITVPIFNLDLVMLLALKLQSELYRQKHDMYILLLYNNCQLPYKHWMRFYFIQFFPTASYQSKILVLSPIFAWL